jgi:formylglycine-generating enzyme required for sulfatase activity
VASQTTVQGNLLDAGQLHPTAARGPGIKQLFGDCWKWTASAYTGYPGYKLLPGALGEYNGKFMSGQMILRGGSCVTPASHIRATYRNFFPPATRWQFSGIRLAFHVVDPQAATNQQSAGLSLPMKCRINSLK